MKFKTEYGAAPVPDQKNVLPYASLGYGSGYPQYPSTAPDQKPCVM